MTVDQGTAYELCGMIAAPDVLTPLVTAFPPARLVALEQELALVPVTRAYAESLHFGDPVPPESGFWQLTPGILALLEQCSVTGPIAYVEAEYEGRTGRQTAAVWDRGRIVLGPRILGVREPFPARGGGPIGVALRRVGAVAVGRRDEFIALGLGRCRRTGEW
jgi:hypothetical protein